MSIWYLAYIVMSNNLVYYWWSLLSINLFSLRISHLYWTLFGHLYYSFFLITTVSISKRSITKKNFKENYISKKQSDSEALRYERSFLDFVIPCYKKKKKNKRLCHTQRPTLFKKNNIAFESERWSIVSYTN